MLAPPDPPCAGAGCPARARVRGLCNRHYRSRRTKGLLDTALRDPAPVAQRIATHVAHGRAIHELASLVGMAAKALYNIADGTTTAIRPTTAAAILAVPLPPTAIGTHRRVQACAAAGWTRAQIAAEAGVSLNTLTSALTRGVITARVASAVDHAYRSLAHRPGPSAHQARLAAARAWAPAMAWDDDTIDDPHARPRGVRRRAASAASPRRAAS